LPSVLKQSYNFGSSFGNQFVLFQDSVTTYHYSFADAKWYLDTAKVPIFPRFLDGRLSRGEWSFYAEDSCLYGSEVYSSMIWKMSK
jgi:hypothetical protein